VPARLVVTMGTAHTFQPLPFDPAEVTADPDSSGGSFWTGAPKLLAAIATLVGSVVALTTVLVQAGVIASPGTPAETGPTVPAQTSLTPAAPMRAVPTPAAPAPTPALPVVPPQEEQPSIDGSLDDLNVLLADSAQTKGDLGTLIGNVQSNPPAIDSDEALRQIDAIVQHREGLHAKLADFPAPAPLAKALHLLRDSITAALADDRLVRQCIVAHYDGDSAADALWQAQLEASGAASDAKDAFRAEYAERLVASGLSSFIPDY
jgi:hypothetical protein